MVTYSIQQPNGFTRSHQIAADWLTPCMQLFFAGLHMLYIWLILLQGRIQRRHCVRSDASKDPDTHAKLRRIKRNEDLIRNNQGTKWTQGVPNGGKSLRRTKGDPKSKDDDTAEQKAHCRCVVGDLRQCPAIEVGNDPWFGESHEGNFSLLRHARV